MNIVYFGYERNLDLDHNFLYLDGDVIHEENREDMIQKIKAFKPDLLLEREFNDGKSHFQQVYSAFPNIPKAWWCIDLHTNLIEHIAYAKRSAFTHIFCAQSWFIPLFRNQVKARLFYLPLCHTQTLEEYTQWLAKSKPQRTIELSFIGNIRSIHVDRSHYVASLLKEMGTKFLAATQDYDTMLETLTKSKMTFNCSLNDDLNFRVWEALATDTPLFTDYVEDITHVADLGRHIHRIYKKETEMRIVEPLEHPIISSAEWIKLNHTLTHRINSMFSMIESGVQHVF